MRVVEYQLFHNLDARFMRAGRLGDRYMPGYLGVIGVSPDLEPRDHLDDVFQIHNTDNRPDGLVRPSLSIGDVVVYRENGEVWGYTVNTVGFQGIPVEFRITLEGHRGA